MKSLFCAFLLRVMSQLLFAADTDGDGLLDLLDVPGLDPNASGELYFEGRGIQDLDGANLLTQATGLWLYNNQITSIESGDFEELSNLRELDLGLNQLTNLEGEESEGLGNLQMLYLGGNQVTSIESGAFQRLDNLQTLNLSSNHITSFERGALRDLTLFRIYFSGVIRSQN